MGKGSKKKSKEAETEGDGDGEKPLPKLVLKVGKEHKKHKELKTKTEHSETHHHSTEGEHSHHKKKKKKHHKHRGEQDKDKDRDKEKKSRKRDLQPEPTEHETPSKKPHLRVHKEKEKKEEPKEQELPPFRLCLENILRNLQRKDVYNIFQFPVSDAVAPGYSKIIKHPMDFLTMSLKVEKGEYPTIEQLKSDFVVMCNNAMLYNGPDTIYYKSADKMLSIGLKMLSKEKIHKMNKSIGVLVSDSEDDVIQVEDADVNVLDPVNTSTEETPTPKRKSDRKKKGKDKEQKDMIESVLAAAHEARLKLLEKQPNQLYGYISKDNEGNQAFNVLNPDTTEETKTVPLTLEKLAPKPQGSQPAGQPYTEDKRNKAVPVNYLLYGPYGSFGPSYDSSLSSTTKEEGDLLIKTYGIDLAVSYAKSLQDFSKDCKFGMDYVDRILDTITDGAHSKFMKEQKKKEQEESNKENKGIERVETPATEPVSSQPVPNEVDMESLLTLDDVGIDVSFLKDLVPPKEQKEVTEPQQEKNEAKEMLSQNVELLQSLKETQYKRLSTKHGGFADVGEKELKMATSLTDNFKQIIKVTTPKDVVSAQGVKKAIGNNTIAPTPEEKEEEPLELSFDDHSEDEPVPMETNG